MGSGQENMKDIEMRIRRCKYHTKGSSNIPKPVHNDV